MPWKLPQHDHERFARNPIALTIAQLRFHPVLSVRERLPTFQDRVRRRFPDFKERKAKEFKIEVAGLQIAEHDQFLFLADGGAVALTLGPGSLAIENRTHEHHEAFAEDFKVGLDALLSTFEAVSATRFGLRYVNSISRARISADLGRDVGWEGLVKDGFLRLPGDLAGLEGTRFASEASAELERGAMTIRHGIVSEAADDLVFRLDVDRYIEQSEFDATRSIELIPAFASDIYSVFISAAGEELLEWMRQA